MLDPSEDEKKDSTDRHPGFNGMPPSLSISMTEENDFEADVEFGNESRK